MKKWILRLALLLLCLLLLFSVINYITSKDKRACEELGGRWIVTGPVLKNGQPSVQFCYNPPLDEGKQCYQDSECIRDCVSTTNKDEEGYIIGKCGEYSPYVCMPNIPNKTKNKSDLPSLGCI